MKRILTALVAGALAIAAVLLLPSVWVLVVALVLFEVAALEYVGLARRRCPDAPVGALLAALPLVAVLVLVANLPGVSALGALAAAPVAFSLIVVLSRPSPGQAVECLGWLSFGLPYLVLPVWSLYGLHRGSPRLLLLFLLSVWVNDTTAFVVGSKLGRHKLAPRLSPNKTWEGAIGGFLGALVVAAVGVLWIPDVGSGALLSMLAVTAVVAQAGDLVESMLKRAVGAKDSGKILPGHGGLLDRLDAIILAAPVFYALLGMLVADFPSR